MTASFHTSVPFLYPLPTKKKTSEKQQTFSGSYRNATLLNWWIHISISFSNNTNGNSELKKEMLGKIISFAAQLSIDHETNK